MSRKIKKYRVNPDESMCLALSIVEHPAVETEFVSLGKQEMEKFVAIDKERRMIYGCALRSDYPIYRNSEKKGEYYLEFDKKAIDKISKDFIKNGFQKNWTAGHKSEVEGLTITESWIKESPTFDKSIAVGLDPSISVGSWFIGCHCENDEIWNAVKEGKYHGFSCEALVGVEDFEKQMEKEDPIEPINEIDLSAMEVSGFTSVEDYKADVEAIKAELEENAPTEPTAETPTEPTVEEPKVEEPKAEETVVEEAPKEETPKIDNTAHLEELINNLKEEISALKEMNSGLEEKIKDMGKQPSATPVNTNAKPTNVTGIDGSAYREWRKQMASYLR